jgi:hypothetical protein
MISDMTLTQGWENLGYVLGPFGEVVLFKPC